MLEQSGELVTIYLKGSDVQVNVSQDKSLYVYHRALPLAFSWLLLANNWEEMLEKMLSKILKVIEIG